MDSKNRGVMMIFVLILIILGLFFYLYRNLAFDFEYSSLKSTKPIEDDFPLKKVISQINPQILSNNKFYSCLNYSLDYCTTQTITDNASKKQDVRICEQFGDKDQIDRCKAYVLIPQVTKTKNFDICKQAGDKQNNCIFDSVINLASGEKDIKYCDLILEKIHSGANDFQPGIKYQDCINEMSYQIAGYKNDLKYCDNISDIILKSDCKKFVESLKYLKN